MTIRRLEICEDFDGGPEIATDFHGPEMDDVVCVDDSNQQTIAAKEQGVRGNDQRRLHRQNEIDLGVGAREETTVGVWNLNLRAHRRCS